MPLDTDLAFRACRAGEGDGAAVRRRKRAERACLLDTGLVFRACGAGEGDRAAVPCRKRA
eukprot:NODE_599_length_1935_cov_5.879109_g479_i0.p4 GENE.NODE_599_length_1935_cov_5.879109_g479_i0~~NODE_599_length_1935_cov_5.879109_g479_i0.p4  ORF type:complete len:60 (-),score=0.23 NODE_599_length_1935_cov_5.879109_g479_i0:918-1097(-)